MTVKKIVTIAGSDSLAGGGIQADLATFNEYGYQGLTVITSIVTVTGSDFKIHPVDSTLVLDQLQSVFALDDISAIKIGLLPTGEHVKLVADFLRQQVLSIPIVVDPVMAFKETDSIQVYELVHALQSELLPLATITTPNLTEASLLTDITGNSIQSLMQMGERILSFGPQAVLVKSGNRLKESMTHDILVRQNQTALDFKQNVLPVATNNGAGCTLSSAIASGLGKQQPLVDVISDAQDFVHAGIANGVELNQGFKVGNVWQPARRMQHEGENNEN